MINPIRILVVEDELAMRRFLTMTLELSGYQVTAAAGGRAALAQIGAWRPDLLLLDLDLPERDGLDVLRALRSWSALPVIALSVCDREHDKVEALNLGADDYLTKPFGTAELLARIQVALRHAARLPAGAGPLVIGDLALDLAGHRVSRGGEELHLTPTEYAILRALVQQRGQVVSPAALQRAVWGERASAESSRLRVFINQLRRKIEADPARPRHLITRPGLGYCFNDSPPAPAEPPD